MNNILITSAGKRVSLIKYFKDALHSEFSDSQVMTCDLNPELAPACYISDKYFKICRVTDTNYINELLNISIKNKIGIIIPTIDTELIILSQNKKLFEQNKINIICSDYEFIEKCRDKRLLNKFFVTKNINIPKPIDKENITYPFFVKPYDGSLSKDIFIVNNKNEYTDYIKQNSKLMYMEVVDNKRYKEYTVDLYYGRDHKIKSIIPRERIEIRAGEINKGLTHKNKIIDIVKDKLYLIEGVIGPACIQVFFNEELNNLIAIEINPRFGGGYPLSYHAGANFPMYIIREYLHNEVINYTDEWNDKTLMLRYDNEIIINNYNG